MKKKFLFLFLLTFLLIPFKANALTDANSIKNIYYYWTEAGEKTQTSYGGLATNSVTNIIQIGSFDSLVSTNTEFTGMNFSSGDNVYVKVIFTFWHDSNEKNKPTASQINLDNFSTIVSMRPIKTNGEVDWGIQYPTTNVSSFFKNYSNFTEVTVSFNVPVKSAGIGFRLSWGDNNTTSSGYLYNNYTLYPVRFGMTRLQYQIVQDSNNVIIDQNQTIIDQNNKTNQKLDELNKNQNQTNQKLDETNKELGDLNSSIKNEDSSGATSDAGNFFSGFTTDTFGLTSIITAPLTLIGNITSSSCSSLGLPIPYVNKTLTLPCMSTIYSNYFGSLFDIYQYITYGLVAYWICVRVFALVKDFKNPDHDEIEVMEL